MRSKISNFSPLKLFVLFGSLFILSCSESDRGTDAEIQLAMQFRVAINVNDVDTLANMIQLPFTVNEQLWTTATDGYGFVLDERTIIRIDKKQALLKFLTEFVPTVGIEGEQPKLISAAEYDRFKTELADSIDDWRNLKTYVFLRGEADVEHIVLVGIQARSHKIKAIYLN